MSDALVVNEIFLSLQGESTWAGLPCVFVRLTACRSAVPTATRRTPSQRAAGCRRLRLAEIRRLATPYAKPERFGPRSSASNPPPPPARELTAANLSSRATRFR